MIDKYIKDFTAVKFNFFIKFFDFYIPKKKKIYIIILIIFSSSVFLNLIYYSSSTMNRHFFVISMISILPVRELIKEAKIYL